jgi:hypothetical protein
MTACSSPAYPTHRRERARRDTGNLPVGPGRDPHTPSPACSQHWSSHKSPRRYRRVTGSAPPLSKVAASACSLTSSRPLSPGKIAPPEIRRAKNSGPRRSIRNTTPAAHRRVRKSVRCQRGRISLPSLITSGSAKKVSSRRRASPACASSARPMDPG